MNRRKFLETTMLGGAAALGGLATGSSPATAMAAPAEDGLRALGDRARVQISASMACAAPWATPPLPDDWAIPELDRIMRSDLHAVMLPDNNPAAMMRWSNRPYHPAALTISTDGPDRSFAYARQAGLGVFTFAGVWQEEGAEWLESSPNRVAAIAELRSYLTALAKFRGQTLWHRAVNECIDFWTGGGVNHITTKKRDGTPNPYYTKIGPDYPEVTFQILREIDPNAKLVFNQYGLWESGFHGQYDRARALTLETIDRIQAKKIKVDYLGLQCHLLPGHKDIRLDEDRFARFLDKAAARGVEILLTELDSQDTFLDDPDVAVRDAKCAAETKRILDIALANKAVTGISLARLPEYRSYFEGDFDRPASTASGAKTRAFLYGQDFRKKPMWDAIAAALRARAA